MRLIILSVELLLEISIQVLTSRTDNAVGLNGTTPACLKQEQMLSGVVVLSQVFENNTEKLILQLPFLEMTNKIHDKLVS